jgi:2-hydroxy-3-keto-5-methylthiopentenyl-1-phosphate phosphatase
MKLHFFVGRLGSGKTYVAKLCQQQHEKKNKKTLFIEVSDIVGDFAKKLFGNNPSREDKQRVKEMMKNDPKFILNEIIRRIDEVVVDFVIISGLREYWIQEELEKRYGAADVTYVDARPGLRQKRRGYSDEEFKAAESRDDQIGIGSYIEKIKSRATLYQNNYELE